MPIDLRITGANQLAALARDLRATNEKTLRREMLKGIQTAGKPLKALAKEAALQRLPKRGKLNEFVAASTFSIRTRTTGQSVGVRLQAAKKGHDLAKTDLGMLRHPVYGNESVWVLQRIEPGWFSKSLDDGVVLTAMRKELIHVMDNIVRRIARGG